MTGSSPLEKKSSHLALLLFIVATAASPAWADGDDEPGLAQGGLAVTVGVGAGSDARLSLSGGLELELVGIRPNHEEEDVGFASGNVALLDAQLQLDAGVYDPDGDRSYEPFVAINLAGRLFYGFTTQVGENACGFVYGGQARGEVEGVAEADDDPTLGVLALELGTGVGCTGDSEFAVIVLATGGLGFMSMSGNDHPGGVVGGRVDLISGPLRISGSGSAIVGENNALGIQMGGAVEIAVTENLSAALGMDWVELGGEGGFTGTVGASFAL
ncbi:MAG: hypothetical protein IT285_15035 [Bdellovibrionales bacterium]|nr:hypothetical protein [Bdellovibrionales bacterium]